AVVQHHGADGAGVVLRRNRGGWRNEVRLHDFNVLFACIGVALGRTLVIVERDTGRDYVDEGESLVLQARLEHRHELSLVAGKAASNKGRAEREREETPVDGLHRVLLSLLAHRSGIGRGGELPFGQTVDTVVL